ncbi:YciK family oxidoreductase [Kangiella koreensis]|uniref:Short-chain dehydrogenase/reductase SDR n=1 Tax=Kangiella koreensis (strain DSM 16069 / JCM 12317 / KCTC 12182 / SW-125) TaxID=523791 RepID=C7RAL3_KANKD|nr:YciK family oxidoreductase [Kangiella koreensis]ACV26305.1 short-chain dehydrogenase/reductase SDR [Kangiella koreensis DSM 16069]
MQDYQATPDLLKNKVILVTGSTSGIGKEIAMTYAKHGATVILLSRDTRKLEKVYDEIEAAGYPQPAFLPVNLQNNDPQQYQQVADVIEKEFGRLDALVHNAGDLGLLSPIEHFDEETWFRVMQINVNAEFLLTKYCMPLLRKSDDASILFTSSGVGRQGRAYWGAYAVSKFATEGLMQVLADELESANIRVNSINPGATRTKMRANAYPGEDPNTLPTPADLMPAYLWLMDREACPKTGQAINARDFIK